MSKLITYLANAVAGIIAITVVYLAFKAYFARQVVTSEDGLLKKTLDGLGRELSNVPFPATLIVSDPQWAGFGWFIIDFIVFFGGLGLAFFIYGSGNKDN